MPHPPAHEKISARNIVGICFWGLEAIENLVPSFRCASFITIKRKDPIVSAGCYCLVAEIAKSTEGYLHDPRPEFLGNGGGLVLALRVSDDYFIGPQYRIYG